MQFFVAPLQDVHARDVESGLYPDDPENGEVDQEAADKQNAAETERAERLAQAAETEVAGLLRKRTQRAGTGAERTESGAGAGGASLLVSLCTHGFCNP